MELEDLVPDEKDLKKNVKFKAGLMARKNIALTEDKLIEFKNGLGRQSYQVVARDKIVSTKFDYVVPKMPYLVGVALFLAGINFDGFSQLPRQMPELTQLSMVLNVAGALSILYGIYKTRKEHIIKTNNPDVEVKLPRRGKSTEILNKVTEKL